MNCRDCQQPIEPGWRLCPNCGARLIAPTSAAADDEWVYRREPRPAAERPRLLMIPGSVILIFVGGLGLAGSAPAIMDSGVSDFTPLAFAAGALIFVAVGVIGLVFGIRSRPQQLAEQSPGERTARKVAYGAVLFLLLMIALGVLAIGGLIIFLLIVCSSGSGWR